MAHERRLLVELLHCLGWMFYFQNKTHLWRKEINAGHLILPEDVPRGSTFSTPSGEDHLVLGRIFGPLGILAIDDYTYDHSANLAFTFEEETLRAHLEATDRVELVEFDPLITTFLAEASRFGRSFESFVDGREALSSLPISQAVFQAPPHFRDLVDALCQSGFCTKVNGGFLWTTAIQPYMESARLWSGDKTRDEVREAELTEIWNTMPAKLKSRFMEHQDSGFDVLSFAMIMSLFWYRDRWHEKPEREDLLESDALKGHLLGKSIEIERLYSAGKLQN